eukprot:231598-Pelagomonas_calceolata.AAC.13
MHTWQITSSRAGVDQRKTPSATNMLQPQSPVLPGHPFQTCTRKASQREGTTGVLKSWRA